MKRKISSSDIFDINKKSGALILGKNRLDDYATKFLTKYCKKALLEPIPLPVDDIIKDMGITVREASLSKSLDIFGCCLLLDADIDIYNRESGEYTPSSFSAGTILIDPLAVSFYGEGFKRNTLIHEALHWEKDKTYFQILEIKNKNESEKLYPILCRSSESFFMPAEGKNTKENEVRWLEWQAHRLAPRVLMPKNTFILKAKALIENEKILSCVALIDELSDFFKVSKESAKYRLTEVGIENSLKHFKDYKVCFNGKIESFVKLSNVEAYKLLENDLLRLWVEENSMKFIDGFFIKPSSKLIAQENDKLVLTNYAKKNLKKYALNIVASNFKDYSSLVTNNGMPILHREQSIDNRILTFHPENQTSLIRDGELAYEKAADFIFNIDDSEEIEMLKMSADPKITLCECLTYLMKQRRWNYPEQFNAETEVHKTYHGRIKNNMANNMKKETLFPICIGLRLGLKTTEILFEKYNKIDRYAEPDKIYWRIIEQFPKISIREFNSLLKELGMKELGSDIK